MRKIKKGEDVLRTTSVECLIPLHSFELIGCEHGVDVIQFLM